MNLLVAFNALMNERNVTRAATQVGVSQPAMSAALSRLRNLLGDPLFQRSSVGLIPTPRARDLASPVAAALRQIELAMVSQPVFQPETASVTFKLGLQDYPTVVLLPALLEALEQTMPGVSLNVLAFNDRDAAVDLLDAGVIDAAIGVSPTNTDARILTRPLLRDEFVTIVSSDNLAARSPMNLNTYLDLQHVLVSPEGQLHGLVDQTLAQQGKKRKLALTLPQIFAVPAVVARTNMAATILKRVALHSQASHRLILFPPPLALPEIVFHLIWHRRSDNHPAQLWFREFIAKHSAAL
ncbi:LysR family transcriptional regulator [Glaciimonas immobilis]|uniref:DNA-binding transcriptional LysR family regulator n=1 Tax=Glaciimonas immobilis TaxID=728004 RepID=A0A840RPM4_9BURK|nr:LysR family transcriptional regulator [Glaciimonas immobilis]MBB5199092.1 DNA-binding transcriptional LysR family regulator [Glaciimonas immobilis]